MQFNDVWKLHLHLTGLTLAEAVIRDGPTERFYEHHQRCRVN